jgi:hypothetical protein
MAVPAASHAGHARACAIPLLTATWLLPGLGMLGVVQACWTAWNAPDLRGGTEMKKPFRVATVFTGAAACAAAFTPAAAAMPTAAGATTHDLAPGITATGNITATDDCGSATKGWLYLYYTASEHHGPICLGGIGTAPLDPGTAMAGFCPGNTSGSLAGYYLSQHGSPVSLNVHWSRYNTPYIYSVFSLPTYLTYVHLTGYYSLNYELFLCPATI